MCFSIRKTCAGPWVGTTNGPLTYNTRTFKLALLCQKSIGYPATDAPCSHPCFPSRGAKKILRLFHTERFAPRFGDLPRRPPVAFRVDCWCHFGCPPAAAENWPERKCWFPEGIGIDRLYLEPISNLLPFLPLGTIQNQQKSQQKQSKMSTSRILG